MYVWHNTSARNGNTAQELAEFLVISHCQLDMSRDNASLLVISCGIPSQLKNLRAKVLEHRCQIDRGSPEQ